MRFTWKVSSNNLERCSLGTWNLTLLIADAPANVKAIKALRILRRVIPYSGFSHRSGLSLLALRTEMRAALPYQHPPDRRPAIHARLPRPLINPVARLEEALPPLRVYIVRYRTATRRDRLRQYRLDRIVQLPRPRDPDPPRQRLRMNPRSEQRLIRINIPDAAHKLLIQKQRLDARLAPPERRDKLGKADLQRFRPQPRHAPRELLAEFDAAELPAVVEQQRPTFKIEYSVGMLPRCSPQQQAPRHPQMHHQVSAAFDRRHDELAVAPHREQPPALQSRRHRIGVASAQHPQIAEFRAHHPLANQWCKRTHHGFYFREFWHLGNPNIYVAGIQADFKCWHTFCRVVVALARGAIELPQMVRAHYPAL